MTNYYFKRNTVKFITKQYGVSLLHSFLKIKCPHSCFEYLIDIFYRQEICYTHLEIGASIFLSNWAIQTLDHKLIKYWAVHSQYVSMIRKKSRIQTVAPNSCLSLMKTSFSQSFISCILFKFRATLEILLSPTRVVARHIVF